MYIIAAVLGNINSIEAVMQPILSGYSEKIARKAVKIYKVYDFHNDDIHIYIVFVK